jgi:hypothetical protein
MALSSRSYAVLETGLEQQRDVAVGVGGLEPTADGAAGVTHRAMRLPWALSALLAAAAITMAALYVQERRAAHTADASAASAARSRALTALLCQVPLVCDDGVSHDGVCVCV